MSLLFKLYKIIRNEKVVFPTFLFSKLYNHVLNQSLIGG